MQTIETRPEDVSPIEAAIRVLEPVDPATTRESGWSDRRTDVERHAPRADPNGW
jgi:hypothetical protein